MLQDGVGAISGSRVWGLPGRFGRSIRGRSTFLLHSVKSCADGMEKDQAPGVPATIWYR